MAQFTINASRIDPYKNFRFRVIFGGPLPVAGVSKISALKRTTEVVSHRDGGDLSTKRHSPGVSTFEPLVLEQGITYDTEFEAWATKTYSTAGAAAVSLKDFRKDIRINLYNLQNEVVLSWELFRCWVSEYQALPELDANANAIAIRSITLQYEGFARDEAVVEKAEF